MRKLVNGFVIVAVAAILLAVFVPVYSGGGPARRPTCMVNLKQVAVAELMYRGDNNNRFPPAARWMDLIDPYVKNKAIYTCPSLLQQKKHYGYSMKAFLAGVKDDSIKEPEKAYLFYESATAAPSQSEYLPNFPIPGRHGGHNFVSYADAHVKAVRMAPQE